MTTAAPAPAEVIELTRAQIRSRRKREVRAHTIRRREITRVDLAVGRALFPDTEEYERPRTRGDCLPGGCNAQRPCPWVSCKWHLYLDTHENGSIQVNFPDVEPDEIPETCALDVADREGATLEQVGALINVTRERVRQIEARAMGKHLKQRIKREGLVDGLEPEREIRRPDLCKPEPQQWSNTPKEAKPLAPPQHLDGVSLFPSRRGVSIRPSENAREVVRAGAAAFDAVLEQAQAAIRRGPPGAPRQDNDTPPATEPAHVEIEQPAPPAEQPPAVEPEPKEDTVSQQRKDGNPIKHACSQCGREIRGQGGKEPVDPCFKCRSKAKPDAAPPLPSPVATVRVSFVAPADVQSVTLAQAVEAVQLVERIGWDVARSLAARISP